VVVAAVGSGSEDIVFKLRQFVWRYPSDTKLSASNLINFEPLHRGVPPGCYYVTFCGSVLSVV
jgi:hypothetical protein